MTRKRHFVLALIGFVSLQAQAGGGEKGVRSLLEDPALLGYWSMDEAGGEIKDGSDFQAHLRPRGSVQYGQPGKVGTSLRFDGQSAQLQCVARALNVRGSFSAGAWLQVDAKATPEKAMIVMDNGEWTGYTAGWTLAVDKDKLVAWLRKSPPHAPYRYECTAPLPKPGTWFFALVVYDAEAGAFELYVNGTCKKATKVDPMLADPASNQMFKIGKSYNFWTGFCGQVDEAFVLGRALSKAEARKLHRSGLKIKALALPTKDPAADLGVMDKQLRALMNQNLRGRGWWLWSRKGGGGTRSLVDPGNRLKQDIATLYAQEAAGKALRQALAQKAYVLWTYPDWVLVSQTCAPPTLNDASSTTLTCAQDEIEARGVYVSNLHAKPITFDVRPKGFAAAMVKHIRVRIVDAKDGLLAIVRPDFPKNGLVVPPGESRQLWIEVDSHDLAAGDYKGSIVLSPRQAETAAVDELGEAEPLPVKSIACTVHVYPIKLPAAIPFDVFSFNYGITSGPHIDMLARYRINTFNMGEPNFTLADGKLKIDFAPIDKAIEHARRNHGKLLSIYGFVQKLEKELREKYQLTWDKPQTKELILDYFKQWVAHLKAQGLGYDDYAFTLWDEPGFLDKGAGNAEAKLLEIAPLLKQAEPQARLANDFWIRRNAFIEKLGEYVDIMIPFHEIVGVSSTDPRAVMQALKKKPGSMWYKNAETQLIFRNLQKTKARRIWTYDQKASAKAAHRLCPTDLYRHAAWKAIWNMGFDGVSFFASWYASGGGQEPCKGFEAWREGVEDMQWLLLLRDEISKRKGSAGKNPKLAITVKQAQAILDSIGESPHLRAHYVVDPIHTAALMDAKRHAAIKALIALRAFPNP